MGPHHIQFVRESLHGADAAVQTHAHGPAAEVAKGAVDHGVRHASLAEPDPVRATGLFPPTAVEHDVPHAVRENHPARHRAEHERVGDVVRTLLAQSRTMAESDVLKMHVAGVLLGVDVADQPKEHVHAVNRNHPLDAVHRLPVLGKIHDLPRRTVVEPFAGHRQLRAHVLEADRTLGGDVAVPRRPTRAADRHGVGGAVDAHDEMARGVPL